MKAYHLPPLVPELLVRDLPRSVAFYQKVLGFTVEYERPENHFAMLRLEGSWLMLEQSEKFHAVSERDFLETRAWRTGEITYPFGRGINFQISVANARQLFKKVLTHEYPIKVPLEERWYRAGEVELGVEQFLVMDPDGYLLRLQESLGQRPVFARATPLSQTSTSSPKCSSNISQLTTAIEWREAAQVLRTLRPNLDVDTFVSRRAKLQSAGYRLIGKLMAGELVSIASYTISPHAIMQSEMLIHDMATKSEEQGRGHASGLLAALLTIAKQEECGRVFVHTREAAAFYGRNGFKQYSCGMVKAIESTQ